MIEKLKGKLIVLSMASLFILLIIIVCGMNLINYRSVTAEADEILELLSANKGIFPEFKEGNGGKLPHGMSPEMPYESRYFTVFFDKENNIDLVDVRRIASVDRELAENYAEDIIVLGKHKGYIDRFRYFLNEEINGSRLTFLDCGRRLDSFRTFLISSCLMAFVGFLTVFAVVFVFSGKIVRPMAENYEKQKRFITDAGHEIKTPLTIIKANVDILEMENGKNECLDDIRKQTERLTGLTGDLIMLTRMEEKGDTANMIELPLSDIVSECAAAFRAPAIAGEKTLKTDIEPMLTLKGNDSSLRKLLSVLLENALKYSHEGSEISLKLIKQSKNALLSVSNVTKIPLNSKDTDRIFDRFYRVDTSRNSDMGGYGIGLSVAKAIALAHGGKIWVDFQNKNIFKIFVQLPLEL
ncbi:MAG: HAMP domain-containing histidine kinase [Ruminococcaceae bacterium]|nr:HAMP domain-containing histidine kinase [Oscillospiraceae bacterium]